MGPHALLPIDSASTEAPVRFSGAGNMPRWGGRETRLIRLFYPNYDLLCALLAPRTREAIKYRAKHIGLTRGRVANGYGTCTAWSAEEIARAETYAPGLTGRTTAALFSARRRRGIRIAPEVCRAANDAAKEAAAERRKARRLAARGEREAFLAKRAEISAASRARVEEDRRRPAGTPRPARPAVVVRPVARPVAAPAPAPRPRSFKRKHAGIDPRVIAAAARSPYGFDLIPAVERAVPSSVWPHLRPVVIEDVTRTVLAGRCALADVPALVPAVLRTVQAQHHHTGGRA